MYNKTALKSLMLNENGFGFDPSTGHTYNLSMSGVEIVRMLNNGAEEDALLAYLQETYAVEEHRAVHDMDTFLASLCQYGLLQPTTEGDAA